jgi:hypothetical protein
MTIWNDLYMKHLGLTFRIKGTHLDKVGEEGTSRLLNKNDYHYLRYLGEDTTEFGTYYIFWDYSLNELLRVDKIAPIDLYDSITLSETDDIRVKVAEDYPELFEELEVVDEPIDQLLKNLNICFIKMLLSECESIDSSITALGKAQDYIQKTFTNKENK